MTFCTDIHEPRMLTHSNLNHYSFNFSVITRFEIILRNSLPPKAVWIHFVQTLMDSGQCHLGKSKMIHEFMQICKS